MIELGFLKQTVDRLDDPDQQYAANMHVSGKRRGYTLNLHEFVRDGIRVVGKIVGAADGSLHVSDDLHTNLAGADQRANEIRSAIDHHIAINRLDAPDLDPAADYAGTDGLDLPLVRELDLAAEGISIVIWATG